MSTPGILIFYTNIWLLTLSCLNSWHKTKFMVATKRTKRYMLLKRRRKVLFLNVIEYVPSQQRSYNERRRKFIMNNEFKF